MIGAIVGEYFGGSSNALGVQIQNDAQLFDFETRLGRDLRRQRSRDRLLRCVALAERFDGLASVGARLDVG